ncbi:MFS transporter [Streptomonospora sp. PA3]|uniref:MFS transporter n=1 Tax=Streptomonospora sp. PA3 TaxID=2607326 RepID=UPI0012DE87DE|nr:MFS transporter [Streptomonospora sp. PA3]MUL42998.1 MFS transporter [Streptomonospora sp. PA3]
MANTLRRPRRTRSADDPPADTGTGVGTGLLLLMSAATGLAVAGNYVAQPLLEVIGRELGLSTVTAGLVVTAAQVGYALGLILVLPLGDLLERRGLAVGLLVATAGFLLVAGAAPNGAVLLAGTLLTALTSVAAQVLVPFAVALAEPERRGRVVGTVMTGLLLGGLLARTASGALAELSGWRTVYWVDAVLVLAVALLLWRRLPRLRTGVNAAYPALLASTLALFRHEPVLRWRAGIGALSMASFNVLWTAVAFLLAGPGYGWSEAAIGLFGLVGVAGALTTPFAGRLADRGLVQAVSGTGTAMLAVSWIAIGAGGGSLGWLLGGTLVLNVAQYAVLNGNQNVIYALRPEIRNRLNSAFMTAFFAGGAAGSALAAVVWASAGWTGVSVLGGTLAAGTFALWALERAAARSARSARGPADARSER